MYVSQKTAVELKRQPRVGFPDVALLVYVAAGLFGTLWISDDFDDWRFPVVTFIGIPVAVAYFSLLTLFRNWLKRFQKQRIVAAALLIGVFTAGTLPLINAAVPGSPSLKRQVEAGRRVVIREVRRGGLGLLYRRRW